MKRILILKRFCMMIICIQIVIGCGADESQPPAFSFEQDPGGIDPNCCGATFSSQISGVSPFGGQYYWAALTDQDSLVLYGEPVFIPEGPYSNVLVAVPAGYLDQIPAAEYDLQIYSSSSLEDVGQIKLRTMAAASAFYSVVSYADSVCSDCCTNHLNGGRRRYSAYAYKKVPNVAGANALIQTKYGRLCGENTPTSDTATAQQGCFVAIIEHADKSRPTPRQLQTGWILRRMSGVVDSLVYFEITIDPADIRYYTYGEAQGIVLPLQDVIHEYRVERIDDTTMLATYDQLLLERFYESSWSDLNMEYATWQGEIDGRETDMPGTSSNPSQFNDCKYWLFGGSLQSASFDNSSPNDTLDVTRQSGNKPAEWGISYTVGTGDFLIWDKHPFK